MPYHPKQQTAVPFLAYCVFIIISSTSVRGLWVGFGTLVTTTSIPTIKRSRAISSTGAKTQDRHNSVVNRNSCLSRIHEFRPFTNHRILQSKVNGEDHPSTSSSPSNDPPNYSFYSSNQESNNSKNQKNPKQRIGRTGWNHNLPDESSPFWIVPDSYPAGSASSQPQSSSFAKFSPFSSLSSSSSSSSPKNAGEGNSQPPPSSSTQQQRTGWLHNTESPEARRQRLENQQNNKASSAASSTSSSKPSLEKALLTSGGGGLLQDLPLGSNMSGNQKEFLSNKGSNRQVIPTSSTSSRNHRIISSPTFFSCGSIGGNANRVVAVTEHVISVPLCRKQDQNVAQERVQKDRRIDIYFTVVEKVDTIERRQQLEQLMMMGEDSSSTIMTPQQRAIQYVKDTNMEAAQSMMLYLQGGPGFGSPTPQVGLSFMKDSSWASKAMDYSFTKIVLMDQRGTGQSTPITKQTLETLFPNLFLLDSMDHRIVKENAAMMTTTTTPTTTSSSRTLQEWAQQYPDVASKVQTAVNDAVNYLIQFRADNIVYDAEEIRESLLISSISQEQQQQQQPKPWGCVLGQSYGGFCLTSYLSLVDHPPQICLFTGGIPPILSPLDEVYCSLWDRVKDRSLQYYDQYPNDIVLVKRIVRKLLDQPILLPSGGTLTARRFLQLGLALGGSPSTFARLHELIRGAFVDPETNFDNLIFRRTFIKRMDTEHSFDDAPIYYWLHESIYADSNTNSPTSWSAYRMLQSTIKSMPLDFDYEQTCQIEADMTHPTLFFGEMIFPFMAEDFAELRGVGLTAMVEELANKNDWDPLYNFEQIQSALGNRSSRCKAAAVVYYDDMYVDFDASMKVTSRNGPFTQCKVWVTNEYQHSGLRDDGAKIFEKLYGMATGSIRTPS